MSWDDWCNGAMCGCNKCGIFDEQGNPWGAKPNDFKKPLPATFMSSVNTLLKQGMASGIGKLELEGIKFFILRVEDGVIVGKQGGDKGITITKSKSAIIVGYFDGCDKNMNPGMNRKCVEDLKTNLENAGY